MRCVYKYMHPCMNVRIFVYTYTMLQVVVICAVDAGVFQTLEKS